jgi:hypothetical protein
MSAFIQLMFDAMDRIQADGYCAGIPVIPQLARDPSSGGFIQRDIDEAMEAAQTGSTGKAGLAVYIFLPKCSASKPNVITPFWDEVELWLTIIEEQMINVDVNGFAPANVGIRADALAFHLAQLFHQWSNDGCGKNFAVRYCDPMPRHLLPAEIRKELKNHVIWELGLRNQITSGQLAKASMPALGISGSAYPYTVTMTGADTGADVYYTTDGSLPRPDNGTKYSIAITIAAPCMFRGAAYKEGAVGSDVRAKSFT